MAKKTKQQQDAIFYSWIIIIAIALIGFYLIWEKYTAWVIAVFAIAFIITFILVLRRFGLIFSKKPSKKKRKGVPSAPKQQVYLRAGYRCERYGCYENKALEIHHIDENPSNNVLHNLLCVCPTCHTRIHAGEWSQSTQCSWIMVTADQFMPMAEKIATSKRDYRYKNKRTKKRKYWRH